MTSRAPARRDSPLSNLLYQGPDLRVLLEMTDATLYDLDGRPLATMQLWDYSIVDLLERGVPGLIPTWNCDPNCARTLEARGPRTS